jgi:hypothetical protein
MNWGNGARLYHGIREPCISSSVARSAGFPSLALPCSIPHSFKSLRVREILQATRRELVCNEVFDRDQSTPGMSVRRSMRKGASGSRARRRLVRPREDTQRDGR